MAILSKKKQTFKPVFLYKDEGAIKRHLRKAKDCAPYFKNVLIESQKLFKDDLSEIEKQNIIRSGWSYLESLIKKKYNFPNANDVNIILSLQGLNSKGTLNSLTEMVNAVKNRSKIEDFIITKNNEVYLSDEAIKGFENVATFHTRNEKQNEALEIAENLCKLINQAIESDFTVHSLGTFPDLDALKDLITPKLNKAKPESQTHKRKVFYIPNYEKIRFMGDY